MATFSAVIPAAGLGTRFLPLTKTVPKELLPIGAFPAVHLILNELIQAHGNHACIITSPEKQALRHYLTRTTSIDTLLYERHEEHRIRPLYTLLDSLKIDFALQEKAAGLGHAILQAQPFVTDHPFFAVILPDDLIITSRPLLRDLFDIAVHYNALVLTVQEVAYETISSYGVIAIDTHITDSLFRVTSVIEKPNPPDAPSRYAIIGRYILPASLFSVLARTKPGYKGEIQLTDAIKTIIDEKIVPVLAYKIESQRFDLGTPEGWLCANNYFLAARTKPCTIP